MTTKNKNKISIGYFGLISDDTFGYRDIKIIYNSLSQNSKIKFSFFGNSKIKNNTILNFQNLSFIKIYHILSHKRK